MTGFLSDGARWDLLASLSPRERAFVTKKIANPSAKPIDIMREIEPSLKSHSALASAVMANEVVKELLADSERRSFHAAGVTAEKVAAEYAHIAFASAEELTAHYGGLNVTMANKLEALKKLGEAKGIFIDKKEHSIDKSLVELLTLGEDSDTGPGPSSG